MASEHPTVAGILQEMEHKAVEPNYDVIMKLWASRIRAAYSRETAAAPRDEDLRLAHHYLSLHRSCLENQRLGYLRRYEDSDRVFTNEKAKADYVQCDINTIDGWLERFKAFAVPDGQVTHLNRDYTTKNTISFKKEDLGK